MKNKRKIGLCLLAAGLGVSPAVGCDDDDKDASDMVLSVSDNTVDFKTYKTFAIVDPTEDPEDPPADLPQGDIVTLENAIVKELKGLGLSQTAAEDADLLIGSFVRVKTKESLATGFWYEYYWGWYWGYSETWYDEEIVEFDVGTLVVDAVDTRDKADENDDRLVFRGAAMGLVGEGSTGDSTDRIKNAVEKIFEEWPEGSGD